MKKRSILDSNETKKLSKEMQEFYFKKLKELDVNSSEYLSVREILFNANIRLFSLVPKKYYMFGNIDDIVCKCYPALYKAIDNYDTKLGATFSSFARNYILVEAERKMYEEMFDANKHSKRTFKNLVRYFAIKAKLENESGNTILMEDVILEMNLSKRVANNLISMIEDYNVLFNVVSLDMECGEDVTLMDYQPSTMSNPEETLINQAMMDKRIEFLHSLNVDDEAVEMIMLLLGHNTYSDLALYYGKTENEVISICQNVVSLVEHSGLQFECF